MSGSELDLSCPICHEVFSDPVLLTCSHSFCSACVGAWWKEKPLRQCPVCHRTSPSGEPPRNLALRNLSEAFRQQGGGERGNLCHLHSERLKLFCVDHRTPACVVCRDSEVHAGHRFKTLDEAARERREELRRSLEPVREKLRVFEEARGTCRGAAEHIRAQAGLTEGQIRVQFENLKRFLQAEEETRIAALREEERQKSRKAEEILEEMGRSTAALSQMIRVSEEQLRGDDFSFLRSFDSTKEKVQELSRLDDPPPARGALIDVAKHLGNLSFSVWSKMKDVVSYSPVVLDPNSAHPELALFDDLSGVWCGPPRDLPANPERFRVCRSVLGAEGFDSGLHRWDVKVGENPVWAVGVATESVDRECAIESGLWSVMLYEGRYTAFSPGPGIALALRKNPRRIRVELNWQRGKLTFSDPDANAHIHTFRHTFTERLFPILRTTNHLPLSIVAEKEPPGDQTRGWWPMF